jgi:hypothetical protein
MRFSQRYGFKPVKNLIQLNYIDEELRNGLWNLLEIHYWQRIKTIYYPQVMQTFLVPLWHNYFKAPIDTISDSWSVNLMTIREYFMRCEWCEVYDFIEFIANTRLPLVDHINFRNSCNSILERELSAYRFVGDRLSPITSKEEIDVIEETLNLINPLKPVKIHLTAALEKLSDKKNPDYRNSIKESISAVEAVCNLITKDSRSSLGKCIKEIEGPINIHPALKKSFEMLYGYTSDADGIRHGLMDEPNLHFEDAKFMLVVCSGFINYLIGKASRLGITL